MALIPLAGALTLPWAVSAAHAEAEPASFITHRVSDAETLMDVARQYDLGFVELRAANPAVDPWLPGEGRQVVLPSLHLEPAAERNGIVVNLADQRLYFFAGSRASAVSFPIGTGRAGCETPTGTTHIVSKRRNPTWVPPASIRAARPELPAAIPPGPNNPLGAYALNLGWENYVIHGTNRPEGIGRRVSHGCLRLYPEDIERLFDLVAVGNRVAVLDQPVKLGWIGRQLYLEVHPSQRQADEIERSGRFSPEPLPYLRGMIESYPGADNVNVDWSLVDRVAQERLGLAVRISR
ncbi:L,D-transpeptidase family protein [Pelagibius litoralis]|uniref:L,D-transpeptidase family protein n=1 Tax=Pelagibius litoralis TaxID=374515 RepID=A0A967KHN4_9PROT|nr:L,D-transpeptidase family protein [Pelagibius litoralis]NIA71446.1 L,D-transpeptidase family protein [Pelagibius litoralis]